MNRDRAFIDLLVRYRATGGLARLRDVQVRLMQSSSLDTPGLAERACQGWLVQFEWQGSLWLPIFQFEPWHRISGQPLQRVMKELAGLHSDGWGDVLWFVQPHAALKERTPLARLKCEPEAVVQAARTDRFILHG